MYQISDYQTKLSGSMLRGGLESATYPWGGPYTIDGEGCFLANFKPNRGDYASDNALYTVEAESYWPNDYGLYNMAGNVSEWTDSAYDKGLTLLMQALIQMLPIQQT